MAEKKFKKGDRVLIAQKHLHGLHATVVFDAGDKYVCRIEEEQFEGHLVSFSDDQLESVNDGDLDKVASERLGWERYAEPEVE